MFGLGSGACTRAQHKRVTMYTQGLASWVCVDHSAHHNHTTNQAAQVGYRIEQVLDRLKAQLPPGGTNAPGQGSHLQSEETEFAMRRTRNQACALHVPRIAGIGLAVLAQGPPMAGPRWIDEGVIICPANVHLQDDRLGSRCVNREAVAVIGPMAWRRA